MERTQAMYLHPTIFFHQSVSKYMYEPQFSHPWNEDKNTYFPDFFEDHIRY